jgi:hypothetical protein
MAERSRGALVPRVLREAHSHVGGMRRLRMYGGRRDTNGGRPAVRTLLLSGVRLSHARSVTR